MRLTRREMLKLGLLGTGALALPIGTAVRWAEAGSDADPTVQSPAVAPFTLPFRVPPVAQPVRSDATTDFYEITQRAAQVEILPGRKTTIWGYDGTTPGPTIMVRRGREAVVRQVNALGVATTTHLHGGDIAAEYDGHPLNLVQPGSFLEHHYPNVQPAATLWYHDHAIEFTGRNVYMGLAGFYLLTDDVEQALPLPKGPFDIPMVIQDRMFNRDGSLFYPRHDPQRPVKEGVFGDVILVNGVPKPFLRVARRKYRFRALNGSDARAYQLALSTGDPLTVVMSDGGFLPAPVETPDLFMMPAERYSFVIDFSRYPIGTQVVLRNLYAPDPFGDPVDPAKVNEIMRFDVVDDAVDDSSIPADLAPLPDLRAADAVATREWEFDRSNGAWTINGQLFDPNRIDATPAYGTTEIWRFVNSSGGWIHPIHAHLVEFLMLDRNGDPPKAYERGPKDTVFLGPNETISVVMKFVHFRGVYVMHCHNLEHEDHDMMTQFEVV